MGISCDKFSSRL